LPCSAAHITSIMNQDPQCRACALWRIDNLAAANVAE